MSTRANSSNASPSALPAIKEAGLTLFHPAVRDWFEAAFAAPTRPQVLGWPAIARGESTLILAPTGSGKTLAAFLWSIDRLMFSPVPAEAHRCRILYISPIKALAVDVERNLQAPIVGIAQAAERLAVAHHQPVVAVRTGDTPAAERARFFRHPSDILVTTPESLYLLLTSNGRDALRSVEAVIVDEIHALAPTKRGSHLALSLERLEHLCGRRLQRIGLSATQRPLDEIAHFLGGVDVSTRNPTSPKKTAPADDAPIEEPFNEFESPSVVPRFRPVTIVDASEPKRFALRIEVPVEDMARLDEIDLLPSGAAAEGHKRASIWSAIHPKLLELIRAHRSTLIFVNARRLAERIAGAVNELAGETLVRAHHGSVAVDQRKEIEDRLKLGTLRALVATSSLELGIDMGAIDLVVQIESPPSVASGMQRVGRGSHHVGAVSTATIFPKHRADLLACAAVSRAMADGDVESTHYPRNPLDVLAQQIVAMVALDNWKIDELFNLILGAAPYAALTRFVFEGVLDMLSGRYPSEEFSELRPRLTWDRLTGTLTARQGARRIAVINGGTIPDRGLYGVFLTGVSKGSRVGELDEEMVFESHEGQTIVLGASTWRIEEIRQDRVIVSPAPGEPGQMPFWKGDGLGRPAEFGEKIGALATELLRLPPLVAYTKLIEEHNLDANAAENLLRYLEQQRAATQRVPSAEDIVIEEVRDELGDRRLCVLTPFGSRVHAPWSMAAVAKLRTEHGWEVESLWSDDGFVIRLPENESPVDSSLLLPSPAEFKDLVLRQLGSTSLFAAKFREAAGRALLLPRRRAGGRTPLWQQRKRAADLLAVAAHYPRFPILLEAYRECMRDVFDLPSATAILSKIARGEIRVNRLSSDRPSPFAASLLFSYVANFLYDGDAPLAERRAQALSIDQSQLEELLGDSDLRELLDPAALDEIESRLQFLDPDFHARHADSLHDLLLKLGDLSEAEIRARSAAPEVAAAIHELVEARRALSIPLAGDYRFIPVEYAARYRDAFGIPLPSGLVDVFLERSDDALTEIVRRYARTHGPFTSNEAAHRYSLPVGAIEPILRTLRAHGKVLEGEFRPRGSYREWCDPKVLQQIRRKSLARLRREVEPVEQHTYARFLTRWQGLVAPRRGLDALLDVVETLQGAAVLVSDLERDILPARIADYRNGDLDTLMAAGEVVWVGIEAIGDRDGRIALYLTESLPLLLPPKELQARTRPLSERARRIVEFLSRSGASFLAPIHAATGGGYPRETLDALWELVWGSQITNDTFHPVRSLIRSRSEERDQKPLRGGSPPGSPELLRRIRSRTSGDAPRQGRWSLLHQPIATALTPTQWSANIAQQLLVRYGIVMRETAVAESIPGAYNTLYPALKTMEESGWIRRGMFVAGLGAAQFATPAAVDMLRNLRDEPANPEAIAPAAADLANPYGTILPWPRLESASQDSSEHHGMSRTSGATVILVNGQLAAFFRRGNPSIRAFLPESEPERSRFAQELAKKLAELAMRRQGRRTGLLISEINNTPSREHVLARFLEDAGFVNTTLGFQMRRVTPFHPSLLTTTETENYEEENTSETA
jgi:ATP-dependent helicase Lhr and Lhr-like helicase